MQGLDVFDSLIKEWFSRRFNVVTEPQRFGWPVIQSGRDVLISAPTGSGKTLAAFLRALNPLIRLARQGALEPDTHTVYVSPLKALSNDIASNLELPLRAIPQLAASQGSERATIRIALRPGDT